MTFFSGVLATNTVYKIGFLACYGFMALSLTESVIYRVADYHAKRDAGIISPDQLKVFGRGGASDGHGDEGHD